jgi:hypothetical protein
VRNTGKLAGGEGDVEGTVHGPHFSGLSTVSEKGLPMVRAAQALRSCFGISNIVQNFYLLGYNAV